MKFLKYFLIFTAVSIGLSIIIYVISGGHILFLLGFIPLAFGGFWSFGRKSKGEE